MQTTNSNAANAVLIDLAFALAEIALSGAETAYAMRASARIKSAMAEIKLLAPSADLEPDQGIDGMVAIVTLPC